MRLKVIFLLLIICMSSMNIAMAHTPTKFAKINYDTNQQFTATIPGASYYAFYVDGALLQNSSSANYTTSWTVPGQHQVTVISDTGVTYTWCPWIWREVADSGDSVSQIDHAYDEFEDAIEDDDYGAFIEGVGKPYVATFGSIYYLIVIGMPFFMLWRRQENLIIPSIIMLISGSVLLGMMPEDWKLYLQAGIMLSAGATFWTLYRER